MINWKETKCGKCKIQREKPICNSCRDYNKFVPITNTDRIRSMSDEELAKENIYFVSALQAKEGLHYTGLDGHYYRTAEEVVEANLKWLRSEVEE